MREREFLFILREREIWRNLEKRKKREREFEKGEEREKKRGRALPKKKSKRRAPLGVGRVERESRMKFKQKM